MTSENLEEKTQEQKEVEAETNLILLEVGIDIGDLDFHKKFNPFKKSDYELTNYNEYLRRILW